MFEFEGDYYNATSIVAILKYEDGSDSKIEILPYGVNMGDGITYNYNTEKELNKFHAEAVDSWKKALGL
jgi:hypothetical protein